MHFLNYKQRINFKPKLLTITLDNKEQFEFGT